MARYSIMTTFFVAFVCAAVAGCASDDDEDEIPESAAAATQAVVAGTTATQALVGPLLAEGETLRDSNETDRVREEDAQRGLEDAVSGNSIVTDPECTAYEWTGLSCTVTFTGCVLEATGESLDGVMTLTLSLAPTTLTLVLDDLAVGEVAMDGTVLLNLGGGCNPEDPTCEPCRDDDPACQAERQPRRQINADLVLSAGEEVTLELEGLEIESDGATTVVSGSGSVESASFTGTFTLDEVTWNAGDCLPSSGTLTYDDETVVVTVTFLPTTPEDGIVSVQMGRVTIPESQMFEPCT